MLDDAVIRTDFEAIPDGVEVFLHPREANLTHRDPVRAHHTIGFFYCDGNAPGRSPDYWSGDVRTFFDGWTPVDTPA